MGHNHLLPLHPSNPSPFQEPVPTSSSCLTSHICTLPPPQCTSTMAAGDPGLIPGWRSFPEGGHGNPLQYSCVENPHEQRSLVGYSPGGLKESDMTDFLPKHLMELLSLRSSGISFVKFKSCLTQFHLVIGAFMKKLIYQYIKNSYKSSPVLT